MKHSHNRHEIVPPATNAQKWEGKKFSVWEFNGIPQSKPSFEADTLQEIRNYLSVGVYRSDIDNKFHCSEGARVFYGDKEISLDAIFSDDDFYTDEEWQKILTD